jgi:DnaJ-class molecular chaperone
MSTRITSGISSKRARESLIRILFAKSNGISATYSYTELKEAYLHRIHKLHPDKHRHRRGQNEELETQSSVDSNCTNAKLFIELKNAWEEYDRLMKLNKLRTDTQNNTNSNLEQEASFTRFGVGCSFSDSPSERDIRNEIMEQACRGWFSGGELTTGENEAAKMNGNVKQSDLEMLDVDMFVEMKEEVSQRDTRKSLVQDLERCTRR